MPFNKLEFGKSLFNFNILNERNYAIGAARIV